MTTPKVPRIPLVQRDFTDSATMARQMADDVGLRLRESIAERGRATLIVPGGTTPGLFFDALSEFHLDWTRVTVTLSDERWIDTTDIGSNEKLVRERLLVGRAARARFISWRSAGADREAAASALSADLLALAPFDVCVLGLGLDGHIASIFPSAPNYLLLVTEMFSDRLVRPVDGPGGAITSERLSLMFSAMFRSRLIVFLMTGDGKRKLFEAAKRGECDDLPISMILAPQTMPVWACWAPE